MKYDDASWHYNGEFPKDIPAAAGGTHIGMFVTWCLLNGLAGELHLEEFPESLEDLKNRKSTPGNWFLNNCDEKFTDEDINPEGNKFALYYYDQENGAYLDDYENTVGQHLENLYHVPDTWETYDKLDPVIQSQFVNWIQKNSNILSITNAFSGKWESIHHGISVSFNDKIWSIVETNDDIDDTLIAFFDESDGSTFFIRVEYLENAKEIDDLLLEETLAEDLYSSDPNLEVKNHKNLKIASQDFYAVDYLFNNKKFGSQIVRHAFIKKDNYIIILLFSWPESTVIEDSNAFPLKHMVFIEGLNI